MKPTIIFTLCCLNMLSAGTLYMFSLYGPQFAEKLHYTQTETNFIAVTGDYGMYLSGPLWGWAVDTLGSQKGCLLGAFFLVFGYVMMALTYNQALFSDSFIYMAIFFAFVGMGSTCSYMSTISILAKVFKDNRGVALGVPIAMYGLSAFIWTTISRVMFMRADGTLNIYGFLLFLAAATCIINLNSAIGFNQLPIGDDGEVGKGKAKDTRPVPANAVTSLASGSQVSSQGSRALTPTEATPLLVEDETLVQEDLVVAQIGNVYGEPDISGLAFFKDPEVWAFVFSLICLSGGGLMIINSVGAIIGSLYDNTPSSLPPTVSALRLALTVTEKIPLASLQSTHVSLISIFSCMGRISAGIISDFLKSRHISRLWSYLGFGTIMLVSQCLGAFYVDRVDTLPFLTVLTGLAYGGAFSVSPTITAAKSFPIIRLSATPFLSDSEFWGTRRFASNWGWISWAPALGGLMSNLVFGFFFDEEAQRQKETSESGAFVQCRGVACFRWSFVFTASACFIGLATAVALSFSRRERKAAIKRERLAKLGILATAS
ncbi:major facilitator superfamily domain-containing protein [Endogone sp. FLAS-F59071]|nr:major facilitator superfamily domain-containing protein [Endogone sp. FLAS-F59071]|eukprot:RUS22478.1 major facilitator superfamily domain-containing protein [Endogone sp. FLAS-F59071]